MNNSSKYTPNVLIGKYSDFTHEQYSMISTRIQWVNILLTEKCKILSFKPLEQNFNFDFVFYGMPRYLNTIEEYHKKQRKWWINEKASELAKDCLPSILDRIDEISRKLAQQTNITSLRVRLQKYIQFQLLETALKSTFRPQQAIQASKIDIFPNTSFQYARSRLRKKLENIYFNDKQIKHMTAQEKKKKEKWLRLIEIKKMKYKDEYYMNLIHCGLIIAYVRISFEDKYQIYITNDLKQFISKYIAKKRTSQTLLCPMHDTMCITNTIELKTNTIIKELNSVKVSLDQTQMVLNDAKRELKYWEKKYENQKCDLLTKYSYSDYYKQKFEKKAYELQQLKLQISLLIGTKTKSEITEDEYYINSNNGDYGYFYVKN